MAHAPNQPDRRREHVERMLLRAERRSRQASKLVEKWKARLADLDREGIAASRQNSGLMTCFRGASKGACQGFSERKVVRDLSSTTRVVVGSGVCDGPVSKLRLTSLGDCPCFIELGILRVYLYRRPLRPSETVFEERVVFRRGCAFEVWIIG